MSILYLAIALAVGCLIGGYWMRNQLTGQRQVIQAQLDNITQQLAEAKVAQAQVQDHNTALVKELAGLEVVNKGLREQLGEQKTKVDAIQEKLTLQFSNLANTLLEEKSKKFTDQNKLQIEGLLKPLGERIQAFEQQVNLANKESLERNVALRTEIRRLNALNTQVTKEAENLAKAIKGDMKIQGNWGEFILENILEKSGLVKDREYMIQASFVAEDGKRYQPDVIVNLPDQKHLIIDAKVSLVSYEQFFNAEETVLKEAAIKQHLQSIRRHLKELNEKNYQQQYGLKGLDFVLMFIPIEPAFSLAVQHDLTLFNEAYEKNIVIVSPSTLIATLRTIASIWKHEHQSQHALEIAQQSGALYDKFVGLVEDLKGVGRHIASTQKVYGEAMKKLYEGKGNLVKRAERIKKLGARTSKTLDSQRLESAEVNEE